MVTWLRRFFVKVTYCPGVMFTYKTGVQRTVRGCRVGLELLRQDFDNQITENNDRFKWMDGHLGEQRDRGVNGGIHLHHTTPQRLQPPSLDFQDIPPVQLTYYTTCGRQSAITSKG